MNPLRISREQSMALITAAQQGATRAMMFEAARLIEPMVHELATAATFGSEEDRRRLGRGRMRLTLEIIPEGWQDPDLEGEDWKEGGKP